MAHDVCCRPTLHPGKRSAGKLGGPVLTCRFVLPSISCLLDEFKLRQKWGGIVTQTVEYWPKMHHKISLRLDPPCTYPFPNVVQPAEWRAKNEEQDFQWSKKTGKSDIGLLFILSASGLTQWNMKSGHDQTKRNWFGTMFRSKFPEPLVILVCDIFCGYVHVVAWKWDVLLSRLGYSICLAWHEISTLPLVGGSYI